MHVFMRKEEQFISISSKKYVFKCDILYHYFQGFIILYTIRKQLYEIVILIFILTTIYWNNVLDKNIKEKQCIYSRKLSLKKRVHRFCWIFSNLTNDICCKGRSGKCANARCHSLLLGQMLLLGLRMYQAFCIPSQN